MEEKFYSQYGEDQILNKLMPGSKGFCIEIGGYDGITRSNSYFFEKNGWDCLIIEPIPFYYEQIKNNRKCVAVNCAVSDTEGISDFYIAKSAEELSSLTPDLERIKRYSEENLEKIQVERRTLNSILEELAITKIDFITIDVEGHELAVLKGFDLNKYSPSILIIEDNANGNDRKEEKYLKSFGYVLIKRTGCNDWYTFAGEGNKFYNITEVTEVKNYMRKLYIYNKLPLFVKKIYRKFLKKEV